MDQLPLELVSLIARSMLPKDLFSWSLCNKNYYEKLQTRTVWESMLSYRFNKKILHDQDPKTVYLSLDRLNVPATEISAAWAEDPQFWQRGEMEGRSYLRLMAVCWFDVHATLIGVPKGRYHVFWRLKATRYLPSDLEFGCSSLDNNVSLISLTTGLDQLLAPETPSLFQQAFNYIMIPPQTRPSQRRQVPNDWTDYCIGEIHLPLEFNHLHFSFKHLHDVWKSGLWIGEIFLRPCESIDGQ